MRRPMTPGMYLVVLVTLMLTVSVNAEVPQYINYQGRLTDDADLPVKDGEYNMIFAIWDQEVEGDMLWADDFAVMVENGLFTVALGPLSDQIFTTRDPRWLSIELEGEGVMEPRIQLVSVPYAFNALRADTAYYVAAAVNCGWTRDGHTVRLVTPGDSVGIGTATPSAKLDVNGDIKASDSMIARTIRIGSLTQDGSLTIRGNETSGNIFSFSEFNGVGGGRMAIFESDGSTYSHSFEADADDSGGGYMAIRGGDAYAVIVDGNYSNSNNPYIGFFGADRSAIFNMNETGDNAVDLPNNSISSSEIWNEAGVANSSRTSAVILGISPTTVLTREMYFPSSGYVVVIGTVEYNFWHANGTIDQIRFGISMTEGVIPSDQDNVRNYPATWSTFNFNDNMTVHDYYGVEAGINTFYLLGDYFGNFSPTSAAVNYANLTVMFFPTWRGSLFSSASENDNPEQVEIDQMIMKKIESENEALRQEFENKLEAIKAEIRKQEGQQ